MTQGMCVVPCHTLNSHFACKQAPVGVALMGVVLCARPPPSPLLLAGQRPCCASTCGGVQEHGLCLHCRLRARTGVGSCRRSRLCIAVHPFCQRYVLLLFGLCGCWAYVYVYMPPCCYNKGTCCCCRLGLLRSVGDGLRDTYTYTQQRPPSSSSSDCCYCQGVEVCVCVCVSLLLRVGPLAATVAASTVAC